MSGQVTLAQVLECAPPEWAGTEHGKRSRQRVGLFTGWRNRINLPGVLFLAVDTFTPIALAEWTDHLRASGQSPATVNRCVAAVLSVWRRAHRRGLLGPPPTGMYSSEPKGRRRVLSPEEEIKLLAALTEPYRSLTVFLLATGARVGEALSLRWKDIGQNHVVFMDTKNSDDRRVPISAPTADLLTALVSDRHGPFFSISQSAFGHAWAAARASIGLEDDAEFVPHACRHSRASRLVLMGVPIAVVAKYLGHRSIRSTARYVHCSDRDVAIWLNKIGEICSKD